MAHGPQVDEAETLSSGHEALPEATLELERKIVMSDNACSFCDEADMWGTTGVAMGWVPEWHRRMPWHRGSTTTKWMVGSVYEIAFGLENMHC